MASIERLESALDRLALEIEAFGAEGEVLLPIYAMIENELAAQRAAATAMDSVRARLKARRDQTAERSSSRRSASV